MAGGKPKHPADSRGSTVRVASRFANNRHRNGDTKVNVGKRREQRDFELRQLYVKLADEQHAAWCAVSKASWLREPLRVP